VSGVRRRRWLRRRAVRQRVLAPTAVLVVAWPLLLASGPGRWCPTKPSPSPSPSVTKTVAPKPTTPPPAPKPAAVLPPPPSPSYSPPPPKVVPPPVKRHPAPKPKPKPKPTVAFVARGDLVPPTPSSQHKNLPLLLLVIVVLAPCVAAAVTRYVKLR